jgi:hypothetical protein
MEHAQTGKQEDYYIDLNPEIIDVTNFYVDEAKHARIERDLIKKEPDGYTEITKEYADEYFPGVDLKVHLGAGDVTLPVSVPNTKVVLLLELGIIDTLEEANIDAAETAYPDVDPISVAPVIDIAKFLGKENDESSTMLESGIFTMRQAAFNSLRALKRVVIEPIADRAADIKAAAQSILSIEE